MKGVILATAMVVMLVGRVAAQRLDSVTLAIDQMTLRQRVARMLIVGVDGVDLRGNNPIIRDVEQRGVAGVIFFEKNLASSTDELSGRERFARFVADIQSHAPHTLLMAIDQEGGAVNRLKSKYGFDPQPSQRAVGGYDDDLRVRAAARDIANAVSSVGLNLNFSPCVDVDINPLSPIVGAVGRSFSADVARVSHLAKIYAEEHRTCGVLTAIKHFPGHGSSLVDSHLGFTDISSTWRSCELQPYFDMVRGGGCDMVMVSHLYNREIDSVYPASLSPLAIEWLLRQVIGWQGVVVSDDMQMRAIVDHYGFEEGILLGVAAGVDLFIISGNLSDDRSDIAERFISTIVDAVERGEISPQRIERSLRRTLRLKL